MKTKAFWTVIWSHIVFFVVGTAIFAFLFHTPLFKRVDVFFYRGIALLAVSCILMLLVMLIYKKRSQSVLFTWRDIILSTVLIASVNLVFFTHLPVTAERSVSVFLLGYMNEYSEKSFTNEEITKALYDKYIIEYGAVGKRLHEQLVSGDIYRDGDGYKITSQGKSLMKIYSLVADLFGIDKRFVVKIER
jgi:hypothetical protein